GRHIYRPDSQGREARVPAGPTGGESRPSPEFQNRQDARHHRPAAALRPRRRGDRMTAKMKRREFITLLGGAVMAWPLAGTCGLVRRQVAVIATAASATTRSGLVWSQALPGINWLAVELAAKRLRLLHDLVPKAVRVAVLLNPANASSTESQLRIVQEAAPTVGLQPQILNATTIGEIDASFATLERERPDALFVAGDAFFASRAVQFAILTARGRIPATYSVRDYVAVGGLMSYGTDFTEAFRQVGVCTGKILRGAKAVDLPVVQSTKFEFIINMQTARALGLEVPAQPLATVDEVIE